jgi:hypothetical protein
LRRRWRRWLSRAAVWLSEDAFRQVTGKVAAEFADLGEQQLKNNARPVPSLSQPVY